MLILPIWGNLAAAFVALIPALLSAWWGRALVRMAEDAAIGERLLAHRRRVLLVTIITAATLAVSLPGTLIWSIPLLILCRAIAAFPTRRALFGDTWNLAEYLLNGFRLYAALLGFWILLAACPFLVSGNHWWISIFLFAILCLWDRFYAETVLRLLGASPLRSEALRTRFERVMERSRVPAPSIWRAGPVGAIFANALALPSMKNPSVLISRTLLDRLNEEEIAAIFAHEIAHLEHYNRARLWRGCLAILGLIIAGTFLIPYAQSAAPPSLSWVRSTWPVLVLLFLAIRSRNAQINEQASDLRAVELCGNAESLINALVKLHAIGLVPRRWELQMEASASHPSLAHRIRSIRNAAPSPLPGQPWCEIFRAAENGVYFALDHEGLRQFWSVPPGCPETMEALEAAAGSFTLIRFGKLAELRIAAKGNLNPELIFTEIKGERRSLKIRPEDLSRVQRTLDRVDVLLPPVSRKPFVRRQVASVAASIAAIAALLGAQLWSVTFVSLAAALRPTIRLIATAAIVSILSLVLILTRGISGPEQRLMVVVAGILPVVAVAVWICLRSRNETFAAMERVPKWVLWTLGAAAVVCCGVPFLAAQGSLLSLSRISRGTIAPAVLPCAMALLLIQRRKLRLSLAALFGIAGCTAIVLGTQWFREQIIHDPLSVPLREFRVSDLPARQVARFNVKPWPSDLRLAPHGTRIAVRYGDSEDDEDSSSYELYGNDGTRLLRLETAVDLRFLDESNMLVLNALPSGLVLDLVGKAKSSAPIWRFPSGVIRSGRLAVDPETGQWRVLSQNREGKLMRFQGTIGKEGVAETVWPPPVPNEPWANHGVSGSGSFSIWVHQRRKTNEFMRMAAVFAAFTGEYPLESSLYIGRQEQESLVSRSGAQVTCVDPPAGKDQFICLASYSGTTNFLTIDPLNGVAHGLGALRGSTWASAVDNTGTVILCWNDSPALLHLRKRQLFRIAPSKGVTALDSAARVPGTIGILSTEREQATVAVYHFDEELVR